MPDTKTLTSSSFPHWSQLLEKVYEGRQTYEFKKGDHIPLHSHDVWIVCRGVIKLSTCQKDGTVAILGLACAEMPFGLPPTQVAPYEAIAFTDVVLMRLSQMEMEQTPALAQGILLQLNRRLQQAEALFAVSHHRRMHERLQELLLLLGREIGEQTSDGIQIGIRLNHQQLADLVGTTRVTVTRILGLLRKQGWLSVDRTRHFVLHESSDVDLQ